MPSAAKAPSRSDRRDDFVAAGGPATARHLRGGAEGVAAYLFARMAIVEARVRAAVDRRRADDADPNDRFRGLYISDAQVDGLPSAGRAVVRTKSTRRRRRHSTRWSPRLTPPSGPAWISGCAGSPAPSRWTRTTWSCSDRARPGPRSALRAPLRLSPRRCLATARSAGLALELCSSRQIPGRTRPGTGLGPALGPSSPAGWSSSRTQTGLADPRPARPRPGRGASLATTPRIRDRAAARRDRHGGHRRRRMLAEAIAGGAGLHPERSGASGSSLTRRQRLGRPRWSWT